MAKPKRITPKAGAVGLVARKAVPASAVRAAKFKPPADGLLSISWSRFDLDGPWCLSKSDSLTIVNMMRRLQSMETMTPDQVFNNGGEPGKNYAIEAIPNRDARKRLETLGFSDETQISRLRITGESRLYGFRRDPYFYALWWDPHHAIWPSQKKNT
ncbi:hypothetical protein ACN27J_21170 [Solwaraspora sp. WMMB762]|uniref:hypothetical protein n=1 Tax=Solwaraspora sp. WMMB762 TaxID=3404120 RepID=UPI003B94AE57